MASGINRSIRFPEDLWDRVDIKAKRLRLTRNGAMALAALMWLGDITPEDAQKLGKKQAKRPKPVIKLGPKQKPVPDPTPEELALVNKILGRAETPTPKVAPPTPLGYRPRELVSTPEGAKLSAPRQDTGARWAWAKTKGGK